MNDLAVLGTYENADNNVEGAVLATYDNNTGFNDSTAYYANNSFENTFNMTETNYESLVDQVNLKAIPGLFPPSLLAQLQIDATNFTGPNNGTWLSSGPGGVIQGNLITYTYGTAAGTMEASQQVVYSPPMPLFVLTPRTDGTHFIFDFGTVSNQSYTVWFNSDWRPRTGPVGRTLSAMVTCRKSPSHLPMVFKAFSGLVRHKNNL